MGNYTVMIIDDDESLHLIVGEYFKQSGYNIIHAENGNRGLELLNTAVPDLILLDIQMPVMDGFRTLEAIRRKKELKDVPIMLLTSLDRHFLKVKGLELGADDYITKPFNKDELMARVNALLRRAERNKRTGGSMEGELSDIGLSDLLQSMELGSKTASIYLRDIEGEIIIKEGSLLHAKFKSFTGEDALVRIFLLERGHFSIKFNEIPQGINNELKPLMSVLMSVLAIVDDVKEVIKRIRVDDRLIKIDDDISEFPSLIQLKQYSPMSFTELLVNMSGDIKENLKILISASKKGKLKIIKS